MSDFHNALSDSEFLLKVMRGDRDAAALALAIAKVAATWDDLVDGDVKVEPEAINQMMWMALVGIPQNRFYREHQDHLQPLMQMGIMNWHLSNELEAKPGIGREIAHVARYSAGDVIVYMAGLIGGLAWVREVGPELKLRLQRDSFGNYDREMEKKHADS